MSEVRPYIMTWRGGTAPADVDLETRVVIHGPFNTEEEATDWIDNVNEEDDPRWHLIMLSDENIEDKILLVPILAAV